MDAIEKLFTDLESNNLQRAEEAKKRLCEQFGQVKENWLVYGMMDYFGQTNSFRIVDVLVKVQQPHDKHIFDRLVEWLHAPAHRGQAITLFGHIVKKHPSWLYKVAGHPLLRDLLKQLKLDSNILTVMNALFGIIILLPIIPTAMPSYFSDLFDIFLYLAAWHCHQQPRLTEDQAIHLQIGLSTFFQRLYGMFPCNFVAYLREHVMKEQPTVFAHTISPLLETVKMHPSLLTSNLDLEKANGRWKEMEPHDVVVECSRFALDFRSRTGEYLLNASGSSSAVAAAMISDCPYYKMMSGRAIVETPISQQLMRSLKSIPSKASSLCSPFYSPFNDGAAAATLDPQRIDPMWSPMWSVMATPPPTLASSAAAAIAAPPTPTPSYAIKPISAVGLQQPQQQQQQQQQQQPQLQKQLLCASGSSPPEAAVEATPETTPMKDALVLGSAARPFPVHSQAVRAIWNSGSSGPVQSSTSQPTSPMRRDASGTPLSFRFGDAGSTLSVGSSSISSPKILSFVHERNMYATQKRAAVAAAAAATEQMDAMGNVGSVTPTAGIDCSTPEDAEVTQINSLARPPLPPQVRSAFNKRSPNGNSALVTGQLASTDAEDTTTTNDDATTTNDEDGDDDDEDGTNGNSPKEMPSVLSARRLQSKRSHFARKSDRISIGTQTIQQLPQSCEQMFDLLGGSMDDVSRRDGLMSSADNSSLFGSASASVPLSPHALLDQYIETAVRKRAANESPAPRGNASSTSGGAVAAQPTAVEQIQLLNLQLQYERYRREVHAERNRRLLGKSRVNASLEMDNEKLREQRDKLASEADDMTAALNRARIQRTGLENEHAAAVQRMQQEILAERAANAEMRERIEALQRSVSDEQRQLSDAIAALSACKAEMFDMRNELVQTQERADWGVRCRDELYRLQHEVLLMGEIQMKCRERLGDMQTFQARDAQAELVRVAYIEEAKEMRAVLDLKSAQLDTARSRLAELESQLARRDTLFTEQKRLLKTVKEEYQTRVRALEGKYTAQKAIILRLEEETLDMYNRCQAAAALHTPDADRQSVVGSLDHASPLSISLASSEGMAISLRSTANEIRNLHPLVTSGEQLPHVGTSFRHRLAAASLESKAIATALLNVASGNVGAVGGAAEAAGSSTAASLVAPTVNRQPVSEDIPVPVPSQRSAHHQHHHL